MVKEKEDDDGWEERLTVVSGGRLTIVSVSGKCGRGRYFLGNTKERTVKNRPFSLFKQHMNIKKYCLLLKSNHFDNKQYLISFAVFVITLIWIRYFYLQAG